MVSSAVSGLPYQAEVVGRDRIDGLTLQILSVTAGVLEGWPRAAVSSAPVRRGSWR